MLPGLYLLAASRAPGKTTFGVSLARALARAGVQVSAAKPIEVGCQPLPSGSPDPSGQLLDDQGLRSLARLRELAGPPPPSTFATVAPERLEPRDTVLLRAASNVQPPLELTAPCRFPADLDPAVAARLADRPLDLATVESAVARMRSLAELVIVEGNGGLCSPLAERELEIDLLARLQLPALVIAASRPGCVHHTLSSLELLRVRGLPCAGVVLNRLDPRPLVEEAAYPFEIERFAGPLVRGVLPHFHEHERLDLDRLARRTAVHIDLEAIVGRTLPAPPPG